MKTTGVSGIPKFGLLDFLGHPSDHLQATEMMISAARAEKGEEMIRWSRQRLLLQKNRSDCAKTCLQRSTFKPLVKQGWKQASKLSRLLLLVSLDQIIRNNETKEFAKTTNRRYSFPLDAVIAEADFVNILKSCFKRLSVARGRLTSWPWLATAPPLSPRSIINLAGRWSYHTGRTQDDWCYTTHRATWSRHQGSHSFSTPPSQFSSFQIAFMTSFSSDAVFFF